METLFVGVVLLSLSLAVATVVYRGSRMVPVPFLLGEGWVANFFSPLVLALFTFGCGFIFKYVLTTLL
ncbi:MAG: hypothetical protein IH614_09970 [Desulfuromonadales bacterium]|nr:hypothetical protein [Desulfuromonadales bacterium]